MSITDRNGLEWANGGDSTDDHLGFGGHEPALIDIGKSMLPEDGVFLDIGAHVGLWSLNLGLSAGAVHSIEANPDTFGTLVQNITRNKGKFTALMFPHYFAAWDKQERVGLRDPNEKHAGGSTQCVPGGEEVWAYPIDAVLSHVYPDLVKIDVEGAEARVLRGMRKMISKSRPQFVIEMHDRLLEQPTIREEVLSELAMHGYEYNDEMYFGSAYYVIAKPSEAVPEFDIEVVHVGDDGRSTVPGPEGYSKFISIESIAGAVRGNSTGPHLHFETKENE